MHAAWCGGLCVCSCVLQCGCVSFRVRRIDWGTTWSHSSGFKYRHGVCCTLFQTWAGAMSCSMPGLLAPLRLQVAAAVWLTSAGCFFILSICGRLARTHCQPRHFRFVVRTYFCHSSCIVYTSASLIEGVFQGFGLTYLSSSTSFGDSWRLVLLAKYRVAHKADFIASKIQ